MRLAGRDVIVTSLGLVAGCSGTAVPGGMAERTGYSVVPLQAVEGGERPSRMAHTLAVRQSSPNREDGRGGGEESPSFRPLQSLQGN